MKKTKYEMMTWKEDIYLFHLPWPDWGECQECGHKWLFWREKGFIKLRTITRKRRMRSMDYLIGMTKRALEDSMVEWAERESLFTKGVRLNKKGNIVKKGG